MNRFPKLPLLLITGLTAVLRAPGLFANSFQADEALFATWAREIAIWRDPLLMLPPVDKPPLLFYLQALFYPLFGPVEFAARWPNWIASLLLVPLVGILAWKLYRRAETAVIAAALVALFPLSIQFSATAFTDPLMTFLLMTGFTAVSCLKPGWAGIFFGLALLTKYQAVLFLPLLLGLGWVLGWRLMQWGRWLAGLLPPIMALFAWEFARSGRFLLWHNQIGNFGGVRLSYSWEIWPRLWAWVELWQTAVAPLIFLLLIPVIAWFVIQTCQVCRRPDRSQPTDHLILTFILGYGLFHWLLAIPVWDRYLLPLLPLLAILLARACDELRAKFPLVAPVLQFRGAVVLLALLLVSASWAARNGRTPLGSSPQSDQGAATIAAALADAPYGTVLYDHWFSWQWRYHLFDKRVFVSWFPHADALAADLAAFGQDGAPRYLALPNADMAQPIRRTVQQAGFTLTAVAQSNQIILYEIIYPQIPQITQIKKSGQSAKSVDLSFIEPLAYLFQQKNSQRISAPFALSAVNDGAVA
ncbi:MAG: glycosyltransferase family 39 protein [Anaerolineae bacterium]|nr:glycosyltransferase family 39 protein [Anaerolineae bacterium]